MSLPVGSCGGQRHYQRRPQRNDRATLYLVGKEARTGELVPDANSCSMCKRLIINAGISRVIVRNTHDTFTTVLVEDWVAHDASLQGEGGY